MTSYIVNLVKKEEVAENTMAFYFEKPKGFDFIAGQYITVSLLDSSETDDEGNSRFFSLITAPRENYLGFATRMRDTAFKRVLKNLPTGSKLKIAGPSGSFYLHKDASRPAVFLIGGIGVTPVFSILKHANHEKLSHKLLLIYSNKRPEDAAFMKDLQSLEKENKNFKFVATMTEPENSSYPWSGETGYINETMIKKYINDFNSPFYYMSGPPIMVKAMKELLNKANVDENNIRSEEFSGY
ncbi:MAG: FAD-dependent oxidoreductase [bacterium]|nr:FAD-dependent oxidoreductase [bacterium]